MFREFASEYRRGLEQCYDEVSFEHLERIAELLFRAYREGRHFFFLGNGGSATTASHMAVDFGKGTAVEGKPRVRAVSLTDNLGLITAWANDSHYDHVFQEQLKCFLEPGDIVFAISASGNSPNVLRAAEFARAHGAVTIGLIGFGGGKLKHIVDMDITVSSRNYGQIEDLHLTIDHILSQYLRSRIANASAANGYLKFIFSNPPATQANSAILLDRDGVINEKIEGGYVTEWCHFQFRPGIKRAMSLLAKLGRPMVVISNQAAVGKSLLSPQTLEDITRRYVADLHGVGAYIDAVYYCPHTPEDNCGCRKPRLGLFEAAARDWSLDLTRSVFIGDSETDIQAAQALHCPAVLVSSTTSAGDSADRYSDSVAMVRDNAELPEIVSRLLQSPAVESA